jgi:hypothetical protein
MKVGERGVKGRGKGSTQRIIMIVAVIRVTPAAEGAVYRVPIAWGDGVPGHDSKFAFPIVNQYEGLDMADYGGLFSGRIVVDVEEMFVHGN